MSRAHELADAPVRLLAAMGNADTSPEEYEAALQDVTALVRLAADAERYKAVLEEIVRREGYTFTSWDFARLARETLNGREAV